MDIRPGSETPDNTLPLARRIRGEQIRLVFLHSPTTTLASLVAALCLVWIVYDQLPMYLWLGWFSAMCLHQIIRVLHYRRFLAVNPRHEALDYWGRLYLYAIMAAGALWGGAGVLLYVPDSPTSQTYLAMLLFCIVAVS